jgi:hypothetical protein
MPSPIYIGLQHKPLAHLVCVGDRLRVRVVRHVVPTETGCCQQTDAIGMYKLSDAMSVM